MRPLTRLLGALRPRPSSPTYQPIPCPAHPSPPPFSRTTYAIFLLLGTSMLWAWNMFLAASAYFTSRLTHSPTLQSTFPPTLISVSAVTNLASMLLLTRLHRHANYPLRISAGLTLNIAAFTLLAASTSVGRDVPEGGYFAFLMAVVFAASAATGLCQNGVFAFVAAEGRAEYTQAIMTGQAVAGVLPCVAQIVSVLAVPDAETGAVGASTRAAAGYFLTATGVSAGALGAFAWLVRGRDGAPKTAEADEDDRDGTEGAGGPDGKPVRMWTLLSKLRWHAAAVFACFALTMLFPVFTQAIPSVRAPATAPRLFRPACFIPLAFLLWNAGDLAGRLLTLSPALSLVRFPRALLAIAVARLGFVPLYLLCNVRGRGAVVGGDAFYLVGVQFLFGVTNGYLGSSCMMGAAEWVEVEEREAAGGFMGLMLVGGLTTGSLLSFLVAGV